MGVKCWCKCVAGAQLLVWNQHSQQPTLRLTEHTAAVKAIAWSPHQSSLLASGGGTADRCIRFWNTSNGHQLNSVDTGSQVTEYYLTSFRQLLCSYTISWCYPAVITSCSSSSLCNLQVCNLAWSKNVNELVSTHGYSQNQIMVWKYPSMAKVWESSANFSLYFTDTSAFVFLTYWYLSLSLWITDRFQLWRVIVCEYSIWLHRLMDRYCSVSE